MYCIVPLQSVFVLLYNATVFVTIASCRAAIMTRDYEMAWSGTKCSKSGIYRTIHSSIVKDYHLGCRIDLVECGVSSNAFWIFWIRKGFEQVLITDESWSMILSLVLDFSSKLSFWCWYLTWALSWLGLFLVDKARANGQLEASVPQTYVAGNFGVSQSFWFQNWNQNVVRQVMSKTDQKVGVQRWPQVHAPPVELVEERYVLAMKQDFASKSRL